MGRLTALMTTGTLLAALAWAVGPPSNGSDAAPADAFDPGRASIVVEAAPREPLAGLTDAGMADPGMADAGPADRVPANAGYVWPTGESAEVLRGFDAPDPHWQAGHRGVDLAAAAGTEIRAAGDGVIVFAGWVVDRSVVSIDHPDGIRTTYEPVAPMVRSGEVVGAGQVIGVLEAGHCDPACLHWGARRGTHDYLDPLTLLGERPVIRLLPDSSPAR